MAKKEPSPTPAQARLLARMFAGKTLVMSDHAEPTARVVAARGWTESTGKGGEFPNGTPFSIHQLSDAGEEALLRALLKRHHEKNAKGT